MIRTVAALLEALKTKELDLIRSIGITHAPTIGDQYEGLTTTLLEQMLPPELQLQVVSGFVRGVGDELSDQIDCMLVRGSGTPIPHKTGAYVWPIRDVLAVLEVKKTLLGSALADAHDQLGSVMSLFWPFINSLNESDLIDIAPPRYVYGQITGNPAPTEAEAEDLPFAEQQLYRSLIADHVAPARIILGYGGYQSEYTLRAGFLDLLAKLPGQVASGGSSLPSMIICGQNTIVKTDGQPFYLHSDGDEYLCYASSSESSLLFLLNLILTKVANACGLAPDWFTRDLTIERFAPLLWGRAVKSAETQGWVYSAHTLTARELERVPTLAAEEWRPIPVSEEEAVLIGLVGNDGIMRGELIAALESVGTEEQEVISLVEGLRRKRLVGWKGECLVFLTRRCATAFTPRDGMVACDLEDERFVEWMFRSERWQS